MTPKWIRLSVAAAAMLGMAASSSLALAQNSSAESGAVPQTRSAEPGSTAAAHSSSKVSRRDREFMSVATRGNLAEIAAGHLAQKKSDNEQVKSFGERMVSDHSAANDQLTALAQKLDVKLPQKPSRRDENRMKKLEGMSGTKFETAYAHDMIRDHRADIKAFEREAEHGTNPEVKQFAQSTLPTLKEHLSLAERLPGEHRAASAAGAPPAER